MKLFIVVAFAMLVQALALPAIEDPTLPEHMPNNIEDPTKPEHKPRRPDEVQWFRDEIDFRFIRFQIFYDLLTDQMTRYRLDHVNSVTEITFDLMRIFANDLDYIRQSADYVNNVVADVLAELGGTPNACLSDIIARLEENSALLGRSLNECSRRANHTVATGLAEVFYPTFASIQDSASIIPLLVIQALSLGNVLDGPEEIIDYLESQYEVVTLQWLGAASQLFRWETNRWMIEGGFYIEEMVDCFADPVYQYSNTNSYLMFSAWDNCRP